jgi:RHS repeat-associated protein
VSISDGFSTNGLSMGAGGYYVDLTQLGLANGNLSNSVSSGSDVAGVLSSAPINPSIFAGIGGSFGGVSGLFDAQMNSGLNGTMGVLGTTSSNVQAAARAYAAADEQVAASYSAVGSGDEMALSTGAAGGSGSGWFSSLWQNVEAAGAKWVATAEQEAGDAFNSVVAAGRGALNLIENPQAALDYAEGAVKNAVSGAQALGSTALDFAENPLPYLQAGGQAVLKADAAILNGAEYVVENPLATLKMAGQVGLAIIEDPAADLQIVGGIALDVLSGADEVAGGAADATGVGAPAGLAMGVAGAAGLEEGTGLIASGVRSLAARVSSNIGRDAAEEAEAGAGAATKEAEAAAARAEEEVPTCGDPVDVATGDVVLNQVDVLLPGALPLVVQRAHRSGYRAGRWLGPSWVSTLDQLLQVTRRGVFVAVPDGSVLSYPHPGPGGEVVWPTSGPRWPLARDGDGYTVTDARTGAVQRYEPRPGYGLGPDGVGVLPLVLVTSRAGHQISFEYGAGGVPVSVTHDGGYQLKVTVAGGRVRGLSLAGAGPDGRDVPLVGYRYDRAGNLAQVLNSSGTPFRFSYDAAGRVDGWTDRRGWWYRYSYDEQGRCVHSEGPDGMLSASYTYDPERRVTTYTNAAGAVSIYEITEGQRAAVVTDALGNVTRNDYDPYGQLISRADPLGRITLWSHDEAGNLTAITRPDGSQVTAAYNDQNLPVLVTRPDGATWEQEFNEHGNLVQLTGPDGAVTRYTYDERGNLASITNPLGAIITVECNPAGLPVSVTNPEGGVTRSERDAFGRVGSVTNPGGQVSRLAWTIEGRLAGRVFGDGTAERNTYDAEGNLIAHLDTAGTVTRLEYGYMDRLTAFTAPDGTRTEYGYDLEMRLTSFTHGGLAWRYEYDPTGRLAAETDCNGSVTQYTHDAAGQVTSLVNAAGQHLGYAYDLLGNLTEQHADDVVTTFGYDRAGRLTRAANSDAVIELERDAAGRVVTETCNGATVRSGYDVVGRRVRRVTPSGAETRWAYDQVGHPVALSTAGHDVRFGYGPSGRETLRQLPGGVTLVQNWNAAGRLAAQVLTAEPPSPAEPQPSSPVLGRLAGQAGPGAGRVLQRRAYSYRDDGILTGIDDLLSGPRRLTLDPAGKVTAVAGPGWTESYRYDQAGNITAAAWPANSTATGRPGPPAPDVSQGTREYTGTLITRAGGLRYEHDPAGRIILRQQARLSRKPDTWRYEWDASSRLTAVTTPDGSRWQYLYDPFGRRIAKQRLAGDGQITGRVSFTWDGPHLAEQTTADTEGPTSAQVTTWDYRPGTFTPLTQAERWRSAPQDQVDERFYAIVTDLIGTPAELVSPGGELAGHQQRSLWGGTYWAGAATPLRFPGQYCDDETGLHYNHQRYYDPATGRYLTPDPLGLAAAPNPHTYVPNPTAETDPLGLEPPPVDPAIAAEVQARIAAIKDAMTQWELDNTTIAVAHVTTPILGDEMWISAAGQTGYVRPLLRSAGGDEAINMKAPDLNSTEAGVNDAERQLARSAGPADTINAMGATRPVCKLCQAALPDMPFVTPLK